MAFQFLSSSKSEASNNIAILYEDQIQYVNEFIDLKIIDDSTNKIIGFIISTTSIFVLAKGNNLTIDLAHAYLNYKEISQLFIDYRGDVYPVDINRNSLYALNNQDQDEYLLQKRIEYEYQFGITSSDISALYALSEKNIKAKAVLNWINKIRNTYFDKIQNMNDAKYYDYDYDSCGEIPFTLQEVFSTDTPPISSYEKPKYLYAINETWQSHYHNSELVIIWDDFVKCDDIYKLVKSSEENEKIGYDIIKIKNFDGILKISYKINFINSEYNRIEMQTLLSKNWEEVTDSISFAYSRSSRYVQYGSSTSPSILLPVKSGDEIRLHTKIAYNSTKFGTTRKVSTVWRQSNILMESI